MSLLYITSNRPGAGKTVLALSLLAGLRREDRRVGYFKPFSADPSSDMDVTFARQMVSQGDAVSSPLPVPLENLSAANASEVAEQAQAVVHPMMPAYDTLVVEGPSLHCPQGDLSDLSAQMAQRLNAGVVMVMAYEADLDPDDVTKASHLFGDHLLGVMVNSVTRYRGREVRQGFVQAAEAAGVNFLGALPEDRLMLSASLGQIAEHINGEWVVGQDKANALVERFLIGGNIMDWGETYFGRSETKAVVARGDRPDIQLAALATPTRGLILTGGHGPVDYVYHEVAQLDVPLMVVSADTVATVEALGGVLERSSPHHPEKVARFQELLEQHCNLQVIEDHLA